jgi:hypothetical protein
MDTILGEYSLTCSDKIFVDMEEYFATCPWMNDIYGLKIWMKNGRKWMNFILNVANKCYFCRKLNKRNKVEGVYVGFFQNKSTNEMFKSQFKAILHISLI